MYATTDETDPTEYFVEYKDRAVIDKWILSKFTNLQKFYFENKDTKNSNSMDDGKKSDEM